MGKWLPSRLRSAPNDKRQRAALKTSTRGQQTELVGLQYLQQHGLKPVMQNFRTRMGEIDLIMLDGATLVFVEVRYRRSADFGSPLDSITANKVRRITMTAEAFLQQNKKHTKRNCRFDVLSITGETDNYNINWVKHAFEG